MYQDNVINDILLRIFYMSKTVKALALIDLFLSFFYILFSPLFIIGNLIGICFAYLGYSGSQSFESGKIFSYFLYNCFKTVGSILFPILIFVNGYHPLGVVIMSVVIMLINIYITLFVYKFYRELSNCDIHDVNNLRALNAPVQVIIW